MTSDRPTVPRMLLRLQGLSWPGIRTRAAGRPSSNVRRIAPRARFRVEELESRWLLSTTEVNLKLESGSMLAATQTNLKFAEAAVPASDNFTIKFAPITGSQAAEEDEEYVPIEGFSTAIALPDAPNVEVKGTHIAGDAPDMLMIPVNAATGVIRLSLKSGTAGKPLFESMRVVDVWNRELANTAPGPNTMSIDMRLPVWNQNANAVYVQITFQPPTSPGPKGSDSGNVGDPTETAFPYVLEVTRVPAPPAPASPFTDLAMYLASWEQFFESNSSGLASNSTPVIVTLPETPDPLPTPTPTPTPTSPQDSPDSLPPMRDPGPESPPAPLIVPVAVGPLPMRSAAPLGGVLGTSDPTPQVDPHESTRVELATFDPDVDLRELELELGLAARQVVPVAGPAPEAEDAVESPPIVVMGGPGGLPVLATALIAGPMVSPGETPDAAAPQSSAALALTTSMAPLHLEFTGCHSTPSIPAAESGESPVQPRRTRRAAVLPGVTLALALGMGLMLPDLVAAFQFAPPTRLRVRLALLRRALRFGLA